MKRIFLTVYLFFAWVLLFIILPFILLYIYLFTLLEILFKIDILLKFPLFLFPIEVYVVIYEHLRILNRKRERI